MGETIDVNESHFNLNKGQEGYLTFSWNDFQAADISDQNVFSIILEGEVNTDIIDFSSAITPSLGYDHEGNEYKLMLNRLDEQPGHR